MKTLLILHPYTFTEFDNYKYEIDYLNKKKNYKVIIHDLSNILINKKFNDSWKTKKEKKAIKFNSLISWLREFNKIKKNENIFVYDFLDYSTINFKVLIIKLFLKLSKFPILKYGVTELAVYYPKKNFKFYLNRILLRHKLNLFVYFSKIEQNLFSTLIKFIKFKKVFLMKNKDFNKLDNKENTYLIKYHSSDYSNFLLEKYRNSKKINKKRYIIYLDKGMPYFFGDELSEGRKPPENDIEKYYEELNLFFDNLENFFNAEVLIIPHPKHRIPSLKKKNINPYFCNRISDNSYDACARLIPKSLFVVCRGSSALSYAVVNYKPVQFIYSTNYNYKWNEKEDLFFQANSIGTQPINIASYKKKNLTKNLKINKAKYDYYKFKFLTYKNSGPTKPNYKIIKDLMDRSVS